MGSYTSKQRFYLIDGDELVNVGNDLNYNIKRADERVCPLLGYQYTDVPSVAASDLPKDIGFKWYKTYTNAIWNYHRKSETSIGVWQDPNSRVDSWESTGISFESGYSSTNLEESRVSYSIFNGWVRWRGRVTLDSGNTDFPTNTTVGFLVPPSNVRPSRAKYFFVHGGNSTGDFQVFRIYIPARSASNPRMEYVKYGGTSTAGERYISLNDIYYPLEGEVA